VRRAWTMVLAGVLAASAVPAAAASDATVTRTLARGVAQLRTFHDPHELEPRLASTLARLRRDDGSSARGRRARVLAVRGFTWTLRGVRAQLDLLANDSGNVEAATRDAKRAYHNLDTGAELLRRAARLLGLRLGKLNGH
jgi:hypothetical protein